MRGFNEVEALLITIAVCVIALVMLWGTRPIRRG